MIQNSSKSKIGDSINFNFAIWRLFKIGLAPQALKLICFSKHCEIQEKLGALIVRQQIWEDSFVLLPLLLEHKIEHWKKNGVILT